MTTVKNLNYFKEYQTWKNTKKITTCFIFVLGLIAQNAIADTTELVSQDGSGNEGNDTSYANSVSADGRYVAINSYATDLLGAGVDTNAKADIFVYDRENDTIERVSEKSDGTESDGASRYPQISQNGRYAVFESDASNLVASDTNSLTDIFAHDLENSTTVRVSVKSDQSNISYDGQYVVFSSGASNLVSGDSNGKFDGFIRDRGTPTF